MASARIAAGLVLSAGQRRQAEIEAAVAGWREAQIAKVQAEPAVSGPFWARRYWVRTHAEAESEYERRAKNWDFDEYWEEFKRPAKGLDLARRVQQLARAAIVDGDGYVTLDGDEVRILGLGGTT